MSSELRAAVETVSQALDGQVPGFYGRVELVMENGKVKCFKIVENVLRNASDKASDKGRRA